MTDETIVYPLTGKPFAFDTLITDSAEEESEAARQGQRLPVDVTYALGELTRKADEYARSFGPYSEQPLAEVAAHAATIRVALDRLVGIRVGAGEAAKMTGRTRTAIVHLIQDGVLYAEKEGRDWRIPIYALDALPPKSATLGRPRKEPADAR